MNGVDHAVRVGSNFETVPETESQGSETNAPKSITPELNDLTASPRMPAELRPHPSAFDGLPEEMLLRLVYFVASDPTAIVGDAGRREAVPAFGSLRRISRIS
jgi:hypothetical protein